MAPSPPPSAPPPPGPGASPLFLREEEIRRGIELLHFGQAEILSAMDGQLAELGLGRADQRVLYFVARRPDLTVSMLLRLLGITKQSLGRVLDGLVERGLVEMRQGQRDRRQRLLRLTATVRRSRPSCSRPCASEWPRPMRSRDRGRSPASGACSNI